MPVRTHTRLGEPCWIDVMSSDPARSQEFYTRLFGWTATSWGDEYRNYVTFSKGDAPVAGLATRQADTERPDTWLTYLAVSDVAEAAAACVAAGAQLVSGPTALGDQGRTAVVLDPAGASVALWQADKFAGFGAVDEPGAPVWHEVVTGGYEAALAFYRTVFGWTPVDLGDSVDFRYSTFGPADAPVGGIYGVTDPEGSASHWRVYLGVADMPEAVARVVELGGIVLREPWSSDFGTFAQVADPSGALFLLGEVSPA